MHDAYWVFAILILTLAMFVWGRVRYDLVAMLAGWLPASVALSLAAVGSVLAGVLPLTLVVIVTAVPLILLRWPW